jgi:EmrB/QacA subfamily drug resistance transporter
MFERKAILLRGAQGSRRRAPSGRSPWSALAALALALVVVTVDNTVLNTALPTLARALQAGTAQLQWITDAYTLAFASLLIVAGTLGARFGTRRALIGGLAFFAVGSAAAALSSGTGELIAFRAFTGVAAAFVMPATLTAIVEVFEPRRRPVALSVWSATAGVGVVIGPVLGGLLLDHFYWGSVFWVNVPLAVVAIVAIATLVPAIPARRQLHADLLGAALSTIALAALVDSVIEAPTRGWTSALTLGEAGAGALVLAGFLAWERRCPHPLVDLEILRRRGSVAGGVALAVTFFALFGTLFVFTQYLQVVHGYSPLVAGAAALPFALAMMTTAGTSSIVARRLGARVGVALGLALMAVGLGALGTITATTPLALASGLMALVGLGMGLVMAPASETAIAAAGEAAASSVSSFNSVVRELGGVLGIAAVGSIAAGAYRRHLAGPLQQLPGLPVAARHAASQEIAAAHVVAARLPHVLAVQVIHQANAAFTSAVDLGVHVTAGGAALGAVAALVLFPRRRRPTAETVVLEDLTERSSWAIPA